MNGHRARALRKQFGPQGRPYNPMAKSGKAKTCSDCDREDALMHFGDFGSFCPDHIVGFLRPHKKSGKEILQRIADSDFSLCEIADKAGIDPVRLNQICYGSVIPLKERAAGKPHIKTDVRSRHNAHHIFAKARETPPKMLPGEMELINKALAGKEIANA